MDTMKSDNTSMGRLFSELIQECPGMPFILDPLKGEVRVDPCHLLRYVHDQNTRRKRLARFCLCFGVAVGIYLGYWVTTWTF